MSFSIPMRCRGALEVPFCLTSDCACRATGTCLDHSIIIKDESSLVHAAVESHHRCQGTGFLQPITEYIVKQLTTQRSLMVMQGPWVHLCLPISEAPPSPALQSVDEDFEQQKAFLGRFVGGQKAKLSWPVQEVADQLAWAEAEHVRPPNVSSCFAFQLSKHLLFWQIEKLVKDREFGTLWDTVLQIPCGKTLALSGSHASLLSHCG